MARQPAPAVAYSYIRFSHPAQAEGDSLRRQAEAAAGWCGRNGVRLDTSTTLHDLGRSAYTGTHRENPDRHALAGFLKLVEAGKVPRGSYLIIENLDRLSREHIQPALLLALNLLQAGVRIVQLKPSEMVFDDQSGTLPVMMMMMELSRGHGESAIKSERVGAAWAKKKRAARNGVILSERLPAWVTKAGNKLVLVPAAAAAVRQIFELAAAGYGIPSVVAKLTKDGVPPIGRTGAWTRSYVGLILKDRRAIGEYQPRKGKDHDGDAVPNYYPAVVTEAEWFAARAGARQRGTNPGRVGETQVNVFAGLLKHARDGDSYIMTQRLSKSPGRPTRKFSVLINRRADEGDGRAYSLPYDGFERCVLSRLREIDAHEILNGDEGPDETLALAAELAGVEAELADAAAFMEANGFSATIGKRVNGLEGRKRDLAARLAEARLDAAHPLSESWGEAQTLADAIDNAADPRDARLRLRAALRRIVDSVWLLVVPRGLDRLAAVQIRFAGGERHRDYLLMYLPATPHREGRWCQPYSSADVAALSALDLREPAHAKRLEAVLLAADLDA